MVIKVNIVLNGLLFKPLTPKRIAKSVIEALLRANSIITKYVDAPITKVPRAMVK